LSIELLAAAARERAKLLLAFYGVVSPKVDLSRSLNKLFVEIFSIRDLR